MNKNSGLGLLIVVFLSVTALVSCKTKIDTNTNNSNVLVQVHDDDSVAILENEFLVHKLKKEKVVSRPIKIYLFTFDAATTSDIKLVELLKKSPLVKEAQRNQKVESRKQ